MMELVGREKCRTLRVEECAEILGISRASAYNLARNAEVTAKPFAVVRLGKSLRVCRGSFESFLQQHGM